jgi:hypothetical protein
MFDNNTLDFHSALQRYRISPVVYRFTAGAVFPLKGGAGHIGPELHFYTDYVCGVGEMRDRSFCLVDAQGEVLTTRSSQYGGVLSSLHLLNEFYTIRIRVNGILSEQVRYEPHAWVKNPLICVERFGSAQGVFPVRSQSIDDFLAHHLEVDGVQLCYVPQRLEAARPRELPSSVGWEQVQGPILNYNGVDYLPPQVYGGVLDAGQFSMVSSSQMTRWVKAVDKPQVSFADLRFNLEISLADEGGDDLLHRALVIAVYNPGEGPRFYVLARARDLCPGVNAIQREYYKGLFGKAKDFQGDRLFGSCDNDVADTSISRYHSSLAEGGKKGKRFYLGNMWNPLAPQGFEGKLPPLVVNENTTFVVLAAMPAA